MNEEREERGEVLLYFGIGITTGEVLAGHVGTVDRTDWTVIGSTVNLASRISSVAWAYRVLVSQETKDALTSQEYELRECEPLRLKGFAHAIQPYTVLWHEGHSGPMIEHDAAGEWYVWNGSEAIGPFTLSQLVRLQDFSADSLVSRSGSDWASWHTAARPFRVWLTQTAEGPRGSFTLDEILGFPGNTPETLVRVQGDPRWMKVGDVV